MSIAADHLLREALQGVLIGDITREIRVGTDINDADIRADPPEFLSRDTPYAVRAASDNRRRFP